MPLFSIYSDSLVSRPLRIYIYHILLQPAIQNLPLHNSSASSEVTNLRIISWNSQPLYKRRNDCVITPTFVDICVKHNICLPFLDFETPAEKVFFSFSSFFLEKLSAFAYLPSAPIEYFGTLSQRRTRTLILTCIASWIILIWCDIKSWVTMDLRKNCH